MSQLLEDGSQLNYCLFNVEHGFRPTSNIRILSATRQPHSQICIKYSIPDAEPPTQAKSYHVATDKDPSKFRSIFTDNLQPIATRRKKARGTLLVDIGCSSKCAPLSVSYYNEISGGHIGSCRCSEEGLCRPSTVPVAVFSRCFT